MWFVETIVVVFHAVSVMFFIELLIFMFVHLVGMTSCTWLWCRRKPKALWPVAVLYGAIITFMLASYITTDTGLGVLRVGQWFVILVLWMWCIKTTWYKLVSIEQLSGIAERYLKDPTNEQRNLFRNLTSVTVTPIWGRCGPILKMTTVEASGHYRGVYVHYIDALDIMLIER